MDTIREIVSLADVDAVREERESYSILRCAEIVLTNIDERSGLYMEQRWSFRNTSNTDQKHRILLNNPSKMQLMT